MMFAIDKKNKQKHILLDMSVSSGGTLVSSGGERTSLGSLLHLFCAGLLNFRPRFFLILSCGLAIVSTTGKSGVCGVGIASRGCRDDLSFSRTLKISSRYASLLSVNNLCNKSQQFMQ